MDIVKRLRSADFIHDRFVNPDGPEAADEIERLRNQSKVEEVWRDNMQSFFINMIDDLASVIDKYRAALKEGE